jgi:hypothetical protein
MSVPLNALPQAAFKFPNAQIRVLWPQQLFLSVHKYVYFDHFNFSFQCKNMCTLVTSTFPFSAQIYLLWPLQPFLSEHKYVYFGHFNLSFQSTNMCTLATSTSPFSAQIRVLRPLNVNTLIYLFTICLTMQSGSRMLQ